MIKMIAISTAALIAAGFAGYAGVANPTPVAESLPVAEVRLVDASTLRRAVQAQHAARRRVQVAVYRDACLGWDQRAEHRTGMSRLWRKSDRVAYLQIGSRLGDAFKASLGTDAACEQVERDFCSAARSELQRQGVVR